MFSAAGLQTAISVLICLKPLSQTPAAVTFPSLLSEWITNDETFLVNLNALNTRNLDLT